MAPLLNCTDALPIFEGWLCSTQYMDSRSGIFKEVLKCAKRRARLLPSPTMFNIEWERTFSKRHDH